MKYLFIDTETGGLNPDFSLLEIGYAIHDDEAKTTTFGEYQVRPENGVYHVTAGALGVNKINIVEHDRKALTYPDVSARFIEVVKHASLFGTTKLTPVGHNVGFDLNFIGKMVNKAEWDQYVSYRVLDTATIALFLQRVNLLPKDLKLSLESLAQYFGYETTGNHRALKDVELTMAVFYSLQTLAEDSFGRGDF